MTRNFAASVKAFSQKALRNADVIVKRSAQDVAREMTQPARRSRLAWCRSMRGN